MSRIGFSKELEEFRQGLKNSKSPPMRCIRDR